MTCCCHYFHTDTSIYVRLICRQFPFLSLSHESHVDNMYTRTITVMLGSRKLCQRGSKFDTFFFDEGKEGKCL